MRCCPECGKERDASVEKCPYCEQELQITVLSPQERETFQGVTINQDTDEGREENYQYTGYGPNHRVHIRHVHVSGGSFWSKLLIALTIMAFLAALVFVALPLVFVVVAIVAVVSFIMRLLK